MSFATKRLGELPDATAPDGSEVRVLCSTSRGSLAHFTLPPQAVSKAMVHTRWANRYEPGQLSTMDLISVVLFDSDASLKDLRDYINGITTSQDHFRDAVEREDIPSLGTTFAIPFFVFQGAIDNVTPVAPVREYVDSITAPRKELVLIPNAGHNAIATRSDEFLKLLIERVRPLALESP